MTFWLRFVGASLVLGPLAVGFLWWAMGVLPHSTSMYTGTTP